MNVLHRTLCMKPERCSECDRIEAITSSPSDRYDFDVEIEGFDRLIDWIRIAGDSMNSHSTTERLYGREQLKRAKELIDAILAPGEFAELASEARVERAIYHEGY